MKKLILLLFIPLVSFGQNIDILDNKNGYKIFKLNSNKSNYDKNLVLLNKTNDYSSYAYVERRDYDIVNQKIIISKNIGIHYLAKKYSTQPNIIRSLNPNIRIKKSVVKKNQTLLMPVRKLSKIYTVDESLFDLFGVKISSIKLTFDNSTNKLKKIDIKAKDIESMVVNNTSFLQARFKKLYYDFSEIIGPTTGYNKPTMECLNSTCKYFLERAFKGEVIWESRNVKLKIFQDTNTEFSYDGNVKIIISNLISFSDIAYENNLKNNSF